MVSKTIVARKKVLFRDKCYRRTYRLVTEENTRYGIEILCKCGNEVEQDCVFLDTTRSRAYKIVRLFAQETVFPIALRETLFSYLS